jgi:galactokinase/galacturonokinase
MLQEFALFADQLDRTTAVLHANWQVDPAVVCHVIAPNRICPLGAHIDHQGGHVLGRTINTGTVLSYAPLDEPQVALLSTEFDGMACFTIGEAAQNSHWARYAQAAALVLQQQQPLSKGLVGVASGTLIGAGLSSSASVGLAYLSGLAAVNDISLTADILVELDRQLENDHLGLQNGILDQSSIVYGQENSFTYIHIRERQTTAVPDPANAANACWLVVYSGLPRMLTSTDYNQRVDECHQAAQWLQADAAILSDVPPALFWQGQMDMPESLCRRASHYFGEVERVTQGALAWETGDFERFGELMDASCSSSIHQYECGHEAIIGLQQIASRAAGVYGSRFSGGGYGGCVIALADVSQAAAAAATIIASYREQFPGLADQAAVFLARAADGLQQVGADERQ